MISTSVFIMIQLQNYKKFMFHRDKYKIFYLKLKNEKKI